MKKFPVFISSPEGACKRSLTMHQIEVLFIMAANVTIEKHKKYFNVQFSYYSYGGFGKSVKVKKLPNGYLSKFNLNKL